MQRRRVTSVFLNMAANNLLAPNGSEACSAIFIEIFSLCAFISNAAAAAPTRSTVRSFRYSADDANFFAFAVVSVYKNSAAVFSSLYLIVASDQEARKNALAILRHGQARSN